MKTTDYCPKNHRFLLFSHLFLLLFFLVNYSVIAQIKNYYNFSKSFETYQEISGGTLLGTATENAQSDANLDDVVYTINGLPEFFFNGRIYNSVKLSTNGFLVLGGNLNNTVRNPISVNYNYAGAISAWGSDINGIYNMDGITSDVRYEILGSQPNRIMVFQWKNFRTHFNLIPTRYLSFQIRIHEGTDKIEIIYGNNGHTTDAYNLNVNYIEIGLRGPNNNFEKNVQNRMNTTSTYFDDSEAGTANSSYQNASTMNALPGMPSPGLTYTYTPISCKSIPKNIQLVNITSNSAQISWEIEGSQQTTFEYALRDTNSPPDDFYGATDSTYDPLLHLTNLEPNTTYYIWLRSTCGPSFSDMGVYSEGFSFTTEEIVPETYTWNGSVSSDWNNPNNWTKASGGNGVPQNVDHVNLIFSSSIPNKLHITENKTIQNLGLLGSSEETFTIADNVQFTIEGTITNPNNASANLSCKSTIAITGSQSVTIPTLKYGNLISHGGPRVFQPYQFVEICGEVFDVNSDNLSLNTTTNSNILFTGNLPINIARFNFHNFVYNKSSDSFIQNVYTNGSFLINYGTLTINGGEVSHVGSDLTILSSRLINLNSPEFNVNGYVFIQDYGNFLLNENGSEKNYHFNLPVTLNGNANMDFNTSNNSTCITNVYFHNNLLVSDVAKFSQLRESPNSTIHFAPFLNSSLNAPNAFKGNFRVYFDSTLTELMSHINFTHETHIVINGTLKANNYTLGGYSYINNSDVIINSTGKVITSNPFGFSNLSYPSTFQSNFNFLLNEGTVEYNGNGEQLVTNFNGSYGTNDSNISYKHLHISGSGDKIAENGKLVVSGNLSLDNSSARLIIPRPLPIPQELDEHSPVNILNVEGSIRNFFGYFGKIILESDTYFQRFQPNVSGDMYQLEIERFVQDMNNVEFDHMDYVYWSAPISNQPIQNLITSVFSPGTPINRNYEYRETTNSFVPTTDQVFQIGKGYAIRAESNQYQPNGYTKIYRFFGIPNLGDLTTVQPISYTNPNRGYNLIGNPYPALLDFDQFYATNQSFIEPKYHVWTNNITTPYQMGDNYNGESYATYVVNVGGTPALYNVNAPQNSYQSTQPPNGKIQVAQGFMVKAKPMGDGQKLNFFRNHQKYEHTDFFYRNTIDRFWVKMETPQGMVSTALIAYVEGANNEYNKDFDSEAMTESSDELFSVVEDKKLNIQAREYPHLVTDVVPMGVRFHQAGRHSIELGDVEGIFQHQKIYLRDKYQNKIHDFAQGSYEFKSSPGEFLDRFEIVYKGKINISIAHTKKQMDSKLSILKINEEFVVESTIEKIQKVEVFDLNGKSLFKIEDLKLNEYQLPKIPTSTPIIFINVSTESGEKHSKKFILK